MKKIFDPAIIQKYLQATNIARLFTHGTRDMLELFHFQKKEFVLREGITSDYLYFLADGRVKIYNSIANGKLLDHGQFPLFRVIGEAATLWGEAATASVQCETASYFFGISLPQYRKVLLQDARFLRYTCEVLRSQLNTQHQMSQAMFFSLESRLASLILQNAQEGVLQHSLATCADLLSTSYRHLLRVIGKMCKSGLLMHKEKGRYHVANRAKLEELAVQMYTEGGKSQGVLT